MQGLDFDVGVELNRRRQKWSANQYIFGLKSAIIGFLLSSALGRTGRMRALTCPSSVVEGRI